MNLNYYLDKIAYQGTPETMHPVYLIGLMIFGSAIYFAGLVLMGFFTEDDIRIFRNAWKNIRGVK